MTINFYNKIKTCVIVFLSAIFALCVFIALPFGFNAEAAEGATVSDEVVFYDSYQVNTEITVPNSPIYYGGRQYASEIKVIYPDGSAVILAGKKLLLNQNGKYEIIYYTMANGQYLSVSKVFYVSPSTVSFSGNKSSYYYGSHGKYAKEKEGLVVELAQGETMYYNNIVDLSEINGGKVFSMFATPVSEPMADATRIYVTFTDIYDTSNYVQVLLKFAGNGSEDWSNNNTYCQARASNQSDFVGLEANTGASAVSVAGGRYLVSRNGTYGSPIIFTLGGYINSQYQIGDIEYGVSFDLENKIVYSKTETSTKPISDLKSSLLYDSVWQGFTTGEVFISISAENYNGSVLGLVLTDIGGQDLTKETVTDIPEPSIIVDYDGYDKDSLPDAIVEQRYPVARARAYDAYCGELEYSVKAYYGYDSSFATQVDVNGGYFKPTREGYYTLEYSATNSYGLKKVVTYKVRAVTSDKELGIMIEGKARSGGVGNEVKVAEGYSLSNVNGKADVIITATNISNPSVVYTLGEDLTFIPFYSGFYKIVFSYSDYIFNKTEDYNVNVSASAGSPIIVDEPALPDRFIIGKTYRLPVVSGYIFPNGTPEEKQCDIYVADGNSSRRKLDGNEYVIGNYETVSVVYVISDGTKSKEKAYTIKTVNVSGANGIDTAKYFYTDGNGTAEADSDSVKFTAQSDCEWNFVNLLVSKKVEWRVRLVSDYAAFRYIDFYLTDSTDPDKKVRISFSAQGEYTNISVNGEDKALMSMSFSKFADNDLYIKYDDNFKLFSANNLTEVKIDKYLNGKPFEGFTSGYIKLGVAMREVKGTSKLAMRRINNQNIRVLTNDKTAPTAYYTPLRGYKTVGDTVTFAPATAGDVFDSYSTLKFSVKDSSGNYVTSDDGVILNGSESTDRSYSITLRAFGTFEAYYTVQDSNGNKNEYSYVVHCKDITPPVVKINNAQKQGSVGDVISVASYTATDDQSGGGVTVFITVIKPDLSVSRITDSFTADKAGTYTVSYLFYDSVGNVSSASYDVIIM